MLASVTGPQEAELVLAGGADIVDLKNPARGALGAVDAAIVADTVIAVAGRRPVSAVTGDLPMQPSLVVEAVAAMAATGVDYVKQGVFPGGDARACLRALAPLADKTRLVAVLFADCAPDLSLLATAAEAGFAGAMLDTADKSSGRLLDHMDLPELRHFVDACTELRLFSGLAGSLEAPDVPRLLLLRPGFLGFRGALCGAGGRAGQIAPEAVEQIRGLIPLERSAEAAAGVDYHVLAAHGFVPDPAANAATDLVFVHDLVLPVRIGAYARERSAPQRVRFDVDVAISRSADSAADMRDIFSYDIISDGIRLLVDGGHVALVETLAERIAAMLLAHPRVVEVAVKLEKLDVGSRVVGVKIERRRDSVRLQ
ncbi:MAG TPA: (5-formylfuran-3-yl)methyl phosphate synthase [Acetobacteraceae bacterium]|nr:(5-formylfuran-3-yl)methyl phosphate synthase [Acetobacteraceae bacterium]